MFCAFLYLTGWFLQYARIFLSIDGFYFKVFSQYWIFRNGLFFGLPMMFLGYFIAKHDVISKVNRTMVLFVLIMSAFILVLELYLTKKFIFSVLSYHIDFIISLLAFCPMIFIILMKNNRLYFNSFQSKNIALISTAIYFVHPYVIYFIQRYEELPIVETYLLTVAVSAFISFVIFKLRRKLYFLF
ncbi:hypothetical protein BV494_12835 [Rahnella sikkimica]|uniref:Acyltransferase 3 domain-containing protein n=1 Tax=Rahnella sikkimica TaxID=1805933 RepID=A0A2L1US81_9GAMM|nr:hypothetical protein BV494_12835 [Rahnella sikkimica]